MACRLYRRAPLAPRLALCLRLVAHAEMVSSKCRRKQDETARKPAKIISLEFLAGHWEEVKSKK
jgi:hypothetical protein